MKLPLTLACLFAASLCFGQRQNVYFLKNNGRHVEVRDSADYIRIIREPDSGSVYFNVFEYYPNGKNKMLGKTSMLDPLSLEGQCITYFKNGNKETVRNYKKGNIINNEYDYYPNGKLYQAREFPDDGKLYNEMANNYLIKECRDSLGKSIVAEGNGRYVGYDDSFKKIIEEGDIKNGKRDGLWKGRYDNIHTGFEENYADGQLVSGKATLDDGKIIAYTKSRNVPPQFKGGVEGFGKYLSHNIEYPVSARQNNIQGRVVLTFVVEKNGQIKDIKVLNPVNPDIDNEAVRVLRNSPKWIPGTMFGSAVRVQYSVPISFALSGN
jgi:TonB family protein